MGVDTTMRKSNKKTVSNVVDEMTYVIDTKLLDADSILAINTAETYDVVIADLPTISEAFVVSMKIGHRCQLAGREVKILDVRSHGSIYQVMAQIL